MIQNKTLPPLYQSMISKYQHNKDSVWAEEKQRHTKPRLPSANPITIDRGGWMPMEHGRGERGQGYRKDKMVQVGLAPRLEGLLSAQSESTRMDVRCSGSGSIPRSLAHDGRGAQ